MQWTSFSMTSGSTQTSYRGEVRHALQTLGCYIPAVKSEMSAAHIFYSWQASVVDNIPPSVVAKLMLQFVCPYHMLNIQVYVCVSVSLCLCVWRT